MFQRESQVPRRSSDYREASWLIGMSEALYAADWGLNLANSKAGQA